LRRFEANSRRCTATRAAKTSSSRPAASSEKPEGFSGAAARDLLVDAGIGATRL
jgi:hypothetical protein